jgi:hypothetical protein
MQALIMPSHAFVTMEDEIKKVLGDILAKGILTQSLKKIGATPDSVDAPTMKKAIDTHVGKALEGFMGQGGARDMVLKLKKRLASMENK